MNQITQSLQIDVNSEEFLTLQKEITEDLQKNFSSKKNNLESENVSNNKTSESFKKYINVLKTESRVKKDKIKNIQNQINVKNMPLNNPTQSLISHHTGYFLNLDYKKETDLFEDPSLLEQKIPQDYKQIQHNLEQEFQIEKDKLNETIRMENQIKQEIILKQKEINQMQFLLKQLKHQSNSILPQITTSILKQNQSIQYQAMIKAKVNEFKQKKSVYKNYQNSINQSNSAEIKQEIEQMVLHQMQEIKAQSMVDALSKEIKQYDQNIYNKLSDQDGQKTLIRRIDILEQMGLFFESNEQPLIEFQKMLQNCENNENIEDLLSQYETREAQYDSYYLLARIDSFFQKYPDSSILADKIIFLYKNISLQHSTLNNRFQDLSEQHYRLFGELNSLTEQHAKLIEKYQDVSDQISNSKTQEIEANITNHSLSELQTIYQTKLIQKQVILNDQQIKHQFLFKCYLFLLSSTIRVCDIISNFSSKKLLVTLIDQNLIEVMNSFVDDIKRKNLGGLVQKTLVHEVEEKNNQNLDIDLSPTKKVQNKKNTEIYAVFLQKLQKFQMEMEPFIPLTQDQLQTIFLKYIPAASNKHCLQFIESCKNNHMVYHFTTLMQLEAYIEKFQISVDHFHQMNQQQQEDYIQNTFDNMQELNESAVQMICEQFDQVFNAQIKLKLALEQSGSKIFTKITYIQPNFTLQKILERNNKDEINYFQKNNKQKNIINAKIQRFHQQTGLDEESQHIIKEHLQPNPFYEKYEDLIKQQNYYETFANQVTQDTTEQNQETDFITKNRKQIKFENQPIDENLNKKVVKKSVARCDNYDVPNEFSIIQSDISKLSKSIVNVKKNNSKYARYGSVPNAKKKIEEYHNSIKRLPFPTNFHDPKSQYYSRNLKYFYDNLVVTSSFQNQTQNSINLDDNPFSKSQQYERSGQSDGMFPKILKSKQ